MSQNLIQNGTGRPMLEIENAQIIFCNFSGKKTEFNPLGKRSFHVVIEDPDLIERLQADGWNVRLRDKNPNFEPITTLEVNLRFDKFPPKIYQIVDGSRKPVQLDESNIGNLDYAKITNVDLTINPGYWEVNGKTGIKAWLNSMYVTIQEDRFAQKYFSGD